MFQTDFGTTCSILYYFPQKCCGSGEFLSKFVDFGQLSARNQCNFENQTAKIRKCFTDSG